jgi:signal transduction histidine kinase
VNAVAERIGRIDPRIADGLLALALSGLVLGSVLEAPDLDGPLALNLLLALTMTGALYFRRSRPFGSVVAVCGAALVLGVFLTSPPDLGPPVFAVVVSAYSVGGHAEGRRGLLGFGLITGTIALICLISTPEDILFPLFIFGVLPWMLGRSLSTHTTLARELAEKEARARHTREQEEASAVAVERNRVARELHDVLAHNLSVMVIQAAGARRLLDRDPEAAAEAAELIRENGREALIELRHVFGAVRRGEGEGLEGTPGLANVEGLVERARAAGLPVTLTVEGRPLELSPGPDMAAYRLVQEALTNTLKHAGRASTEVVVGYRPDAVVIEIRDEGDDPAPAAEPFESGGHGLVGMRERVGLYGGEVEAGTRSGGGFVVRARLPFEEAGVVS